MTNLKKDDETDDLSEEAMDEMSPSWGLVAAVVAVIFAIGYFIGQ